METIDIKTVKAFIYRVTNLQNNKVYIGQTLSHIYNSKDKKWYPTGVNYRWAIHITHCRHSTGLLCKDLANLGPDMFKLETVDICEISEVNNKEKEHIILNNSIAPNGYNSCFGTSEINPTKQKILTELSNLEPSIPKPVKSILPKYSGQITLTRGVDKIAYLQQKIIQEVDIRPIKRNNEISIIRVLVATTDRSERYRISFYKKPLKTVAMVEVMDMMKELNISPEKQKIDPELEDWLNDKEIIQFPQLYNLYKEDNVTCIIISPHKQRGYDYIRIIVHRQGDKRKEMNRHVLGTKTECPKLTYQRVMDLVTRLNKLKNIYIIDKCSQIYDNESMSETGGSSGDAEGNCVTA